MDIFSFILGRSSAEQEAHYKIEDIKRETGLRSLEIKELDIETAGVIEKGTFKKLVADLKRNEKKRDGYINSINRLNDIKSRHLKKPPESQDKEYLDKIEDQINHYMPLLNDLQRYITKESAYINEIKINIERVKAKGGAFLNQIKREKRRQLDNVYYIYNNSSMMITDLKYDDKNARYIFLVIDKEDFTNEDPKEGETYHIKYFMNFWLNYRKLGGGNGFYYLKPDSPYIGKTFLGPQGQIYPDFPHVPRKGEFIEKQGRIRYDDAELIINDRLINNPFKQVYNNPTFVADIFVCDTKKKFRDSHPLLIIGLNDKAKMNFLNLILKDEISFGNIFVLDIYSGI